MRNILFTIALIYSTYCMAGNVDTIPANNSLIEYTGRIDFSNPLSPTFSYSGVSIRACFTGTSIAMIMNDNVGQNYFDLILDGKMLDTVNISIGKKLYTIASGLENKTHEIEIFKRTEQQFGKTQFFGFVVDKGSALTTIANKRTKLIEYIGNSITCGYGDEGALGGTFGPTTEDHYMTYAAFTSRSFNARHLAVCKSGIGVYRNYDGPTNGNTDCMTNYYTRTFLYDENPKYSFTDKPDLVCINLGTNDFSTTGADSSLFVSTYFKLIDTIQTKYNKPDIICLLGPMLSGTSLSTVRKDLKFIADSASHLNKGNVYFFEMSQQTGSFGYGIDYHPVVAQHQKNGIELTQYIKSLKGWKVSPLALSASLITANHIQLTFNTPVHDSLKTFSGFTVMGDNAQYTISSAYTDTLNNTIVDIILQQNMVVGEKISLSYNPGTLETDDSIMVGSINSIAVTNNLTVTKITRGATSTDGTKVMLYCNKNITKNSTIDGLSLIDNQGAVKIDSFNITNATITIYCNGIIAKDDSVFASYNGTNINGIDKIQLSGFSKLVIKNSSTVSVNAVNNQNSFEVYPNPNNSGLLYFKVNESLTLSKTNVEVINCNGAIIYKQVLLAHSGEINLGNSISKGLYIFKISNGNSKMSKSVLIE